MSQSYRSIYNKYPNAEGWVYQGVIDVMAGDGITIDKTDPEHPIISGSGGGGGVQKVWAGDNITVDDTDPANPIVSSTGGDDSLWTEKVVGSYHVLGPADINLGVYGYFVYTDNLELREGGPSGPWRTMSYVLDTQPQMGGTYGNIGIPDGREFYDPV
jgi:hypothetical protein